MPESVFIAQFVYWTGKQEDPNGWIYKTVEEVEYETGLTYEQQRRVRKSLTVTHHTLKGHHRTKTRYQFPVIEEKYDRNTHKMYFRVDMDALDKAFSQGQLFSEKQIGKDQEAHGDSPTGTWGKSMSSIQRLQQKTTSKESREAHKEFVKFWDEMVRKVRVKGFLFNSEILFDKAGFRNLKLALQVTSETTLERLGLYFLADPTFKKYPPSLKTFLSSGIMKGLREAQNKEGFCGRLDGYVSKYMGREHLKTSAGSFVCDWIGQDLNKLYEKLTIPK